MVRYSHQAIELRFLLALTGQLFRKQLITGSTFLIKLNGWLRVAVPSNSLQMILPSLLSNHVIIKLQAMDMWFLLTH
jgi:hypothetical protein